jgi:hypothetical protein
MAGEGPPSTTFPTARSEVVDGVANEPVTSMSLAAHRFIDWVAAPTEAPNPQAINRSGMCQTPAVVAAAHPAREE